MRRIKICTLFLSKYAALPKLFAFFLSLFFGLFAAGQKPYWQQQVNYSIDVIVNDNDRSLVGFEQITYTNNSPDTLTFIWMHVWPNAFKNDKTAFSEQQLKLGNTDFYFSRKEERGYINQLSFKVNGAPAKTEDHPTHIDIIKLLLPSPLPPQQTAIVTTPFQVKLPRNFSRSGWSKNLLQVTQWYPKPAVYDAAGWHEMPYLDQGEFYGEFGDFDVRITLPEDYVVAATGILKNEEEAAWLKSRNKVEPTVAKTLKKGVPKKTVAAKREEEKPAKKGPQQQTKTLHFKQSNSHDFAFLASKKFRFLADTCQLPGGKIIDVATYFFPTDSALWKESIQYLKDAVRFYSVQVGEYPYQHISAVQGYDGFGGGMEYPTMAVIGSVASKKELDITIAHEVGHNWFYGVLATNERANPWMDEGINSFYENRYTESKYGKQTSAEELIFQTAVHTKKDQPIATASENFTPENYGLIAYYKAAKWLQLLKERAGQETFEKGVRHYFEKWKFKHPQPNDFKNALNEQGANTDSLFRYLETTGLLPNQHLSGFKIISPVAPGSFKSYLKNPSKRVLLLSPAIGFNKYDRAMIGGLATNYFLPPSRLQFLVAPLYATGSKSWNGLGKISYTTYTSGVFSKIEGSIAALSFSKNAQLDSNRNTVFERFLKLTPAIRATIKQSLESSKERWLEARAFFIGEREFSKFVTKVGDGLTYVDSSKRAARSLYQATFFSADNRVLYPYSYKLQAEGGAHFYRLNFEGNYFFNYAGGGGTSVRLFAAKFGSVGSASQNNFSTFRYRPKLLAATGEEDYTYSNYFFGRSASYANDGSVYKNGGFAAQQIMIRDGGLKLRLDQYEFLQGRSQDWVSAINLTTTLPGGIFPFAVPLKLFLDVGTFSEAWKAGAETSTFLYVGGLQLSILKNAIAIYAPLVYSADFKTYLKALPEQNTFGKRLTFSINLHQLNGQKMFGKLFPY